MPVFSEDLSFWIFCGSRYTVVSVTSAISLVIGSSLGEITGGNSARFGALAAGTALLVSLDRLRCMARESWSPGPFHLGECHDRIQMWRCALPCQHATTEAFRFPRRSWKLLGKHRLLLQTPQRDEHNVIVRRRNCARSAYAWKNFSQTQTVALFVVIGGIIAASTLSLETRGVKLIGVVPQGIPPLKVPSLFWRDLNELLPLALACFLLGAVETAAIGRMFAREARRTIRC
jgi:Sulfate permease and related transporters (MFS superfamily)